MRPDKAKFHLRMLALIVNVPEADRTAEEKAEMHRLARMIRKLKHLPVSTLEDFKAVKVAYQYGWKGVMVLKPHVVPSVAVSAREWALLLHIRITDLAGANGAGEGANGAGEGANGAGEGANGAGDGGLAQA